MTWAVAILSLRWVVQHPSEVIPLVEKALTWFFGTQAAASLHSIVVLIIVIKVFCWFISLFNPELAKKLDVVSKVIPWALKAAWKTIVWVTQTTFHLVEGRAIGAKKETTVAKTAVKP